MRDWRRNEKERTSAELIRCSGLFGEVSLWNEMEWNGMRWNLADAHHERFVRDQFSI